MKANIPGAKEGMYMSTDSITVDVRPIDIHGDYTMEARGLWRMKGDFMGGPFVSHTRLDKANQRIITAEIFVYSPDKLKRNLVRMLEASLYTLKLPAEKVQGEIPMGNVATVRLKWLLIIVSLWICRLTSVLLILPRKLLTIV